MQGWRAITAAGFCIAVLGCATVQHNTASGRPEITLTKVPANTAKSFIADTMMNAGYALNRDSQFQMSFDKPANGLGGVLMATTFGGLPHIRITYSITEQQPNVRIVADTALVQNAGSGFERTTPLNNSKVSQEVQEYLTLVQRRFESKG